MNRGDNTTDQRLPFIPSLAYDAVSILALALNQTITNNMNFIDNCFSNKVECVLDNEISELHFSGRSVSDTITFFGIKYTLFKGAS